LDLKVFSVPGADILPTACTEGFCRPQCQAEGQSILACPASPTQYCANWCHVAGAGCVPVWAILLRSLLPWPPTNTGAVSLPQQHPHGARRVHKTVRMSQKSGVNARSWVLTTV